MSHIHTTSPPAGLSEISKKQLRLTSIYEESWQEKSFIYVEGEKLQLHSIEQLCHNGDELRFSCKAYLINSDVLLIKGKGFLSDREWYEWWASLSAWCQNRNKRCKALILDFAEVRWMTFKSRKEMDELVLRNPAYWQRMYFILSDLLKTIYQIQQRNNPTDYAFVDLCPNIPTALRYIFATPPKNPLPLEEQASKPNLQQNLGSIDQYTKEELYQRLQQNISSGLPAPKDPESLSSDTPPTTEVDSFEDLMQATSVLQEDIMAVVRKFNRLNHSLEKQVEARTRALAEQEANLSAVVENTTDMILSVDRELRVLVINTSAQLQIERRFGILLKRGDLLPEVFTQPEMERWYPYLIKALGGERIRESYQEKDQETGTKHYYEFLLNPIFNLDQHLSGLSIFIKDLTETHLYQREIEEKEQMLSSINSTIKEGIFRTIPEKGIVYINKAFVEMFGYDSEAEMKKVNIDDLYVDPNRRKDFIQIMQDNHYFVNEEVHFKRKDGSTFWGLISSIKSIGEDGSIYQDGAVRNITEIKETKAQLLDQNEELTKVNQELDSFVYRTSHDLRAPLVSIKGLIDVMQMADTQEERVHYMNLMRRSIDRLDGFIRDIIGYSRNSRSALKRQEIDFQELIEGIFESLHYLDKGQQIKREILIEGEPPLWSDMTRIGIIFSNLVSNAIQYSDSQKSQSWIKVHIQQGETGSRIRFSDNGIGISPEHLDDDKIFDMFYRGTQHGQGSGIGLYIVKETVKKLKGQYKVVSEEGQGTSFEFWFPHITEADLEAEA